VSPVTSKTASPPRALRTPRISLDRATRRGWAPSVTLLARWAAAALGRGAAGYEISVLLVGTSRSRSLNARYRGQDHATNVLSFPAQPGAAAPGERLLGDLVICPDVLRREARAQRKRERDHWAHLVVHGVLHLMGFDHERDDQARRMERREVRVLRALGVANPYRQLGAHGAPGSHG
jgi:probable rRNA maturation factor